LTAEKIEVKILEKGLVENLAAPMITFFLYGHCNCGIQYSKGRSQYVCDSIKTFDFSILYTTIPHTLLKSRIKEWFHHCISKKNEKQKVSASCYW
jgi:hypothetical protein